MSVGVTIAWAMSGAIKPSFAQSTDASFQSPNAQSQPQYQYIFVNPNVGADSADGSQRSPLKTITRALQIAQPNTIILLAPGTYSAQSGEVFPLQMKAGTTIKGNPRDRGQNVVLRGGGFFLSRTFARQNVTIVGANQAGLTGVTVTNPNPQGYGLWTESTSPVIVENTFAESNHDGASIVGNSAPILRSNYFLQNGANGITIYGSARPEVQDNIFERTGFGINVAENAAPRIVGNHITQNKDGVIVQGRAQPVLRNNIINGNSRDGVVAIAQSRPNLGTASDPGNNTFTNNGQLDLNTQKSVQVIPVFGNQLAEAKTIGQIDFAGTSIAGLPQIAAAPQPETRAELPNPSAQPLLISDRTAGETAAAPITSMTVNSVRSIAVSSSRGRNRRSLPLPKQPKLQQAPIELPPETNQPVYSSGDTSSFQQAAIELSPQAKMPVNPSGFTPLFPGNASSRVSPTETVIPIVVPLPETLSVPRRSSRSAAKTALLPSIAPPTTNSPILPPMMERFPTAPIRKGAPSAGVLPVPAGSIPVGRSEGTSVRVWRGLLRVPNVANSSLSTTPNLSVNSNRSVNSNLSVNSNRSVNSNLSVNPNSSTMPYLIDGLRYRVLVQVSNETDQAQVQATNPGAFQVYRSGQNVMQVGIFGDRGKADELLQILVNQGLRAFIESI